jgi:hypothetical protein
MSAERIFQSVPSDPDPWMSSDTPAEIRQLALDSLRWQAQEIIDEVLCGNAPGEEPEQALLEQLAYNRDLSV